ncbi:Uncharacterised protein [Mycobacteroides abscessus subsp. abscessus]|nr:Uncharacterised protein [Mycobacteroides abscessus subsp. abscessus]
MACSVLTAAAKITDRVDFPAAGGPVIPNR